MRKNSWQIAAASVIGSAHIKKNLPCQDSCACHIVRSREGSEILLAAVSDGAGSALHADMGSSIAIDFFMSEFTQILNNVEDLSVIDRIVIKDWLQRVQRVFEKKAKQEGWVLKNLACTFLGAIISAEEAIFFQVGDGGIVWGLENLVFWPQHGEFVNQTYFITEANAEDIFEFTYLKQRVNEVALFSDGIERLVLNFSTKTVHPPALKPIFEWLQASKMEQNCSEVLSHYLSSDLINSRTDDDKSLIMAVRTNVE